MGIAHNTELSRSFNLPEEKLYFAISAIQLIPGYENVAAKLCQELEELFSHVKPLKGIKKLGSLCYYPTGIVEITGANTGMYHTIPNVVVLSEWTDTPRKKKTAAKKRDYDIKERKSLFSRISPICSYQFKIKESIRITSSEKLNDFHVNLKKFDILKLCDNQKMDITDIDMNTFIDTLMCFCDLFRDNYLYLHDRSSDFNVISYLLSDKQIKDIMGICELNSHTCVFYSYRVIEEIFKYINSIKQEEKIVLDEDFRNLILDIKEEIEKQRYTSYRIAYNTVASYDFQKFQQTKIYKYSIQLYDMLLNTENETLARIAKEIGMIDEKYIPLDLQTKEDVSDENIEH